MGGDDQLIEDVRVGLVSERHLEYSDGVAALRDRHQDQPTLRVPHHLARLSEENTLMRGARQRNRRSPLVAAIQFRAGARDMRQACQRIPGKVRDQQGDVASIDSTRQLLTEHIDHIDRRGIFHSSQQAPKIQLHRSPRLGAGSIGQRTSRYLGAAAGAGTETNVDAPRCAEGTPPE